MKYINGSFFFQKENPSLSANGHMISQYHRLYRKITFYEAPIFSAPAL